MRNEKRNDSDPFGVERICAKVGVRRAHQKRGRPSGKAQMADTMKEQTGFGF